MSAMVGQRSRFLMVGGNQNGSPRKAPGSRLEGSRLRLWARRPGSVRFWDLEAAWITTTSRGARRPSSLNPSCSWTAANRLGRSAAVRWRLSVGRPCPAPIRAGPRRSRRARCDPPPTAVRSRQQRCQQPHRHSPVIDSAASCAVASAARVAWSFEPPFPTTRAMCRSVRSLVTRGQVQSAPRAVAHLSGATCPSGVPAGDRLDVEPHGVAPVQADEQFLRQ